MKIKIKVPSILIYLFILLFSVTGFVYAVQKELVAGTKQITETGGETTSEDGIKVSKTIEETELENYFDITLKVQTHMKIEESFFEQDLALVVVMDISNTMLTNKMIKADGSVDNDHTRMMAALSAGEDLINNFAKYSADSEAIRKIGLVTFNTDAQNVFNLTDCKSTGTANTLINDMKTTINSITNGTDEYGTAYGSSHTRFTNIEGGLKMAERLLNADDVKDIQNKYVILITDGMPTTYVKEYNTGTQEYRGYNPYMQQSSKYNPNYRAEHPKDPTKSAEGAFYNDFHQELCYAGTDYSDRGAIRARNAANLLKSSGVEIYTVGIGLEAEKINKVFTDTSRAFVLDVDKEDYAANGNKYETGTTADSYKQWLGYSIGSGNTATSQNTHYYDTSSKYELEQALKTILDKAKETLSASGTEPWTVEDPMGKTATSEIIYFAGFLDDKGKIVDELSIEELDQSDTATQSNEVINWNIRNSEYTTKQEGNTTYYIYEIKYRVRIANEDKNGFTEKESYKTNQTTTLLYVYRKDGVLSPIKNIEFAHPEVTAYLGEFDFTKKSSAFDIVESKALSGAEFKLSHDPNCHCLKNPNITNNVHMDKNIYYSAISDSDGKVNFNQIPSGHKYILEETKAPENYEKNTTKYNIEVAYDIVSGVPDNKVIFNDILTGNLKLSKEVRGNTQYSGEFAFFIVVTYGTQTLEGKYLVTKYDAKTNQTIDTEISLSELVTLKNGDYIIIKDLPVGATYSVTEKTTNGYQVKHQINNGEELRGDKASCYGESCSINNTKTQTVHFINTAGYLLPTTGNSRMLILMIIGTILLVGPIIYIAYMFYKYRKEGKVTSN